MEKRKALDKWPPRRPLTSHPTYEQDSSLRHGARDGPENKACWCGQLVQPFPPLKVRVTFCSSFSPLPWLHCLPTKCLKISLQHHPATLPESILKGARLQPHSCTQSSFFRSTNKYMQYEWRWLRAGNAKNKTHLIWTHLILPRKHTLVPEINTEAAAMWRVKEVVWVTRTQDLGSPCHTLPANSATSVLWEIWCITTHRA